MNDLAIRLNDLDRLAGLLPDCTTPRAVAEIARAAVEIRPQGETLSVTLAVEIDDSKLGEHLARLTERPTESAGDAPGDSGAQEDAAADLPEAEAGPAEEEPASAEPPTAPEAEAASAELSPAPAAEPVAEPSPSARPGKGDPWSPEDDARLLQMRAEGQQWGSIAEELGRTSASVKWRSGWLAARKMPKASKAAASATVKPKPVAPMAKPSAPAPAAAVASGVARLVEAMAALDDSFEPADDKLLVEQRYLGAGFPGIAEQLGCDEGAAKARWRAILKCGVANAGGIVTAKGWQDLRAAVYLRAAGSEAEA